MISFCRILLSTFKFRNVIFSRMVKKSLYRIHRQNTRKIFQKQNQYCMFFNRFGKYIFILNLVQPISLLIVSTSRFPVALLFYYSTLLFDYFMSFLFYFSVILSSPFVVFCLFVGLPIS